MSFLLILGQNPVGPCMTERASDWVRFLLLGSSPECKEHMTTPDVRRRLLWFFFIFIKTLCSDLKSVTLQHWQDWQIKFRYGLLDVFSHSEDLADLADEEMNAHDNVCTWHIRLLCICEYIRCTCTLACIVWKWKRHLLLVTAHKESFCSILRRNLNLNENT